MDELQKPEHNYYSLLEVAQDAPQNEIHAAFQRAKETYRSDSPALYSMFSPEEAKELMKLIEEAFSVLGNQARRAEYDRKLKSSKDTVDFAESSDTGTTQVDNDFMGVDSFDMAIPEASAMDIGEETGFNSSPENSDDPFAEFRGPPPQNNPFDMSPTQPQPQPSRPTADGFQGAMANMPMPGQEPEAQPLAQNTEQFVQPTPDQPIQPAQSQPAPEQPMQAVPTQPMQPVQSQPAMSASPPAQTQPMQEPVSEKGPVQVPTQNMPEMGRTLISTYTVEEDIEAEIAEQKTFDGTFIKKVREYKQVNMAKLSDHTRIGQPYLIAIEANDYLALPAPVFVRGFLIQVARVLGLDTKATASSYMKLYKDTLKK